MTNLEAGLFLVLNIARDFAENASPPSAAIAGGVACLVARTILTHLWAYLRTPAIMSVLARGILARLNAPEDTENRWRLDRDCCLSGRGIFIGRHLIAVDGKEVNDLLARGDRRTILRQAKKIKTALSERNKREAVAMALLSLDISSVK